jgi:hypothetical protein
MSIVSWLKIHDTLFHRQQLRQLLEMRREHDVRGRLNDVRAICSDAQVRFHLKHVALQTIASVQGPTDIELDLLLELQGEPRFALHNSDFCSTVTSHGSTFW